MCSLQYNMIFLDNRMIFLPFTFYIANNTDFVWMLNQPGIPEMKST